MSETTNPVTTAGSVTAQAPTPTEAPLDAQLDALVREWLALPEVSEILGIDVVRVRQLLREGQLVALRGGERNVLRVPAAFLQSGRVVKGLPGTLTLLADQGYTPEDALTWLFSEDDSLPGAPVTALRENRGTEVRRRAQALGF